MGVDVDVSVGSQTDIRLAKYYSTTTAAGMQCDIIKDFLLIRRARRDKPS
jgi:hypothetical protein